MAFFVLRFWGIGWMRGGLLEEGSCGMGGDWWGRIRGCGDVGVGVRVSGEIF